MYIRKSKKQKKSTLFSFIFLVLFITGTHNQGYCWIAKGHKRLAVEILSHPTILAMLNNSGLNIEKIIKYCEYGDKYGAHDLYQNGGWYGGLKSWSSFKSVYLNDAKIGIVRKEMPSKWKYPPEQYDLSVYYKNVETVTPGATHITTDAYGRKITITDPAVHTWSVEKYWADSEQMFGLFLHNLTDCAVPVNHSPAGTVFTTPYKISATENSFETTAANNDIPSYSNIHFFNKSELSTLLPNGDNTTVAEFEIFWNNNLTNIFESKILDCAKRLKEHVDNNWYNSTTSAWLTPDCFKALLTFSVPVVCKYIENTNAYISRSGKQPGNTIPALDIDEPKKIDPDISPIIQLLLD